MFSVFVKKSGSLKDREKFAFRTLSLEETYKIPYHLIFLSSGRRNEHYVSYFIVGSEDISRKT